MHRTQRFLAASAMVLTVSACSRARTPAFPNDVEYEMQTLTKATAWTRGPISGAVYVPPGEKLPSAPIQLGVILSEQHQTSASLLKWIEEQSKRGGPIALFATTHGGNDACKAGEENGRTYVSLLVCKTGVARAACVEADKTIDNQEFLECSVKDICLPSMCDRRFAEEQEALDLIAADFLTVR